MKNETTKQGIFGVVAEDPMQAAIQDECNRPAYSNILTPCHWTESVLLAVGDIETIRANRKTDDKIISLLQRRHDMDCEALDMLDTEGVTEDTDQAMRAILATV